VQQLSFILLRGSGPAAFSLALLCISSLPHQDCVHGAMEQMAIRMKTREDEKEAEGKALSKYNQFEQIEAPKTLAESSYKSPKAKGTFSCGANNWVCSHVGMLHAPLGVCQVCGPFSLSQRESATLP